ncbi:glycosyl hydrolase [Polaribacter reichenbachii]|uniref:Glycosyl hydrolase n=1 Tax=Polaribacter reichenbachii TaxID=996801 RepID=A0A1B8U1D3_9FLAO|nr:glycosyl hydrolase 115 family protein [Polaribacter reichenbachii]APZ47345.1 glycosyl hydrolase [Polaribacter reichenbachii]AUC17986.1 glycosyl hydrolase [Polaribacter reichenbachii]OBY65687.1 glycosyl hydrolase [Polaribacter reichenbachii]
MKVYILYITFFVILSCQNKNTNSFVISKKSSNTNVYIHKDADQLIKWAANDLAKDIESIVGRKITINYTDKFQPENKGIYIGQFKDTLIKNLPVNYNNQLKNKWEKFLIKNHQDNLFIVGSDVRGTVYGIFDVAKRIGISPWQWWADVHPKKQESIVLNLPHEGIEDSPSVQYRGIFLNDEDWGLQPWAAKTFEKQTGDIGPKTYEKIFQLLLRLKANTIWPAMHPSTKAFYSIPGNRAMAEKYKISIGTSHAEPMLRNNVDEWDKKIYGDFNYFTNSDKIKEYWQERITETKNGDNLISMGMRGIHDSGMEGNATQEEKVKLLEKIIVDQRTMLSNTINKPIQDIAQVFTLYKEVLDLYNDGLNVPEDITLMWTDDNYGYIRRRSNTDEQQRKGGSGVYYHLSYWGRPHDYLWLSTTQPGLIWYEMSRAYQNGAKKIWIANVGDIKPGEYSMEFFLDLAWDVNSINEATIKKHLVNWSTREFGEKNAEEIADILDEYYRLAFLRKPEYMGWSQTEPTTTTRRTEFNQDESKRRIEAYTELMNRVNAIKPSISKERVDAFFQLVEYPITGAALMNQKFLYAQQSFLSKDIAEKNKLAEQAQKAYNSIITITEKYNQNISNGKWNNMMSMQPRNLPAFKMPSYHVNNTLPTEKTQQIKPVQIEPIFIQAKEYSKAHNIEDYQWKVIEGLGYSNSSLTLFPFKQHTFNNQKPYVEYTFNIQKAGTYQLEIRSLPTHANNFDHKIAVQLNEKPINEFSINTKGRSKTWKENVLRNFASITCPITIDKVGKQTLKVYVNQTGIVLDQIAITPENYQKHYEIVK